MPVGNILQTLKTLIGELRDCDVSELDDPAVAEAMRDLRTVLDAGEGVFSTWARTFQRRGGHLLDGAPTAVSWLTHYCKLSSTSAADRLCVGKQLESLPKVSEALASGEIGYQAASALCHLRDQLGERQAAFDEGQMVGYAKQFRVGQLRLLCRHARYAADPDGFDRDVEKDFERRWLHISPMLDGMHSIDGVLDAEGGAAVKRALEALAHWRGAEDHRSRDQRLADALVEMTHHALEGGKLPRRNGVKPQVRVTVSLEGLRGVPGAPAAELENGMPIPRKTLERICCDGTLSRIVKAESIPVDVGRATRSIPPGTRRALEARDTRCRWDGCDRPITWTNAHHIVFWSQHGATRLSNLVSLCHFHHRLVHEGGWQVIRIGTDQFHFVPPERDVGWTNLRAA